MSCQKILDNSFCLWYNDGTVGGKSMDTKREEIVDIAYRVYKAHGSREAVKADTKYGKFVVIDEKGNPVEEGIQKVIGVMRRLQEENKK